ncbi:uncharacterized protein C3orf85 homolog [Nannospalax galili]|uniref:uncharacterized protein C3orf85 homolog n=1 Tax=Nannospalax galili TaxID=1026970 RepID=UPI00111C4B50|nr:uncharacterized protein C3orf85 homolog [Nannospalax galili]
MGIVSMGALAGVLGAPFLLEDPANQFLHLKRHVHLQDFWDPENSPNEWGITLLDQARETWTSLKATAHHYFGMNTIAFDVSTAQ